MKKTLILFCLLIPFAALAQVSIGTLPEYKKRIDFKFSEEWQYLSTDIYLFNSDKFNKLINKIANDREQKRIFRRNDEQIEYLFITANIKDVKFFGGDLTYPIYNFQVKPAGRDNYKTQVSSNTEVIRIFDNLPLASTNDYVDATISGEAITNKKADKLNQVVAKQLQNISKIANPSTAVLSLVGEFGKFIESKTNGTEYKFNSTIRLYEDQDFNKRLHSVNIYVFVPTNEQSTRLRTDDLTEYLEKNDNPQVNRQKILELLDYDNYPYILIANYKSRYISDPLVGDEIDFETIKNRNLKIEKAYNDKIINKETYIQEKQLIEFLNVFAQLKIDINNYKLNYKNEITKDFSQSFFVILREYRNLKNILKSRRLKFDDSPLFKNEFENKYTTIITNAELYLEEDNNLKSIKELVNTLFDLENKNIPMNEEKRELYLRKLYSVVLPESEAQSNEVKDINRLIAKLERDQYNKVYAGKIRELNTLPANDQTRKKVDELKNKIKATNCKYCREKAQEAISKFSKRYEVFQISQLREKNKELQKAGKDALFFALVKEQRIKDNLQAKYPEADNTPAHIKFIKEQFDELIQKRIKLNKLIQQENFEDLETIQSVNEGIQNISKALREGYNDICTKVSELCQEEGDKNKEKEGETD